MDLLLFKSFYGEIFLSFFILYFLSENSFLGYNSRFNYPILYKEIGPQLICFLLGLVLILSNTELSSVSFELLFVVNESNTLVKIITTVLLVFIISTVLKSFKSQLLNFFEFFVIILISLLGTFLLVSSLNLITIYLALELQALSFYILSSFKKNSTFSVEAALRYFLSGALASGGFLLGSLLLFAEQGTLNLLDLYSIISIPNLTSITSLIDPSNIETFTIFPAKIIISPIVPIVAITAVFLFKMGAAPFHFWIAEVYEGAPLASTVIFTILPKIAIFYTFSKWLLYCEGYLWGPFPFILIASGLLSALIGALMALTQKRLKKLIIYSSIAQIGFLILNLSSVSAVNFYSSSLFFLIIYTFSSFILWNGFSSFFYSQIKTIAFDEPKGFSFFLNKFTFYLKTHKAWALLITISFFSFAGIPPLVGFFSKFFILFNTMTQNIFIEPIILVLLSAVSVFYYLKIIKIIFFDKIKESQVENNILIFDSSHTTPDCNTLSLVLHLLIASFFYPFYIFTVGHILSFGPIMISF